MSSIAPGLIEAMTSNSNADLTNGLVHAIAPYAIAGEDESISDVANKMLRGTPLEGIIKKYLSQATEQ